MSLDIIFLAYYSLIGLEHAIIAQMYTQLYILKNKSP